MPIDFTYDCTPQFVHPTYKFTGKQRDGESGNDYFNARYCASNMGRFMSPDWSSDPDTIPYAEFENPQTLNLYSYGHNNPLVYNDPDGHDVTICDNNGNCQAPISDDAYKAAQQASNSSLNAFAGCSPELIVWHGSIDINRCKREFDQRWYSQVDG